MSATLAPSIAPPHAIRVWVDGFELFAEIPGNPPYIMRLSLSDSGLHKALNLLRTRHTDTRTGRYRVPERLIGGKAPPATDAQRAAARNVLRKMGLV